MMFLIKVFHIILLFLIYVDLYKTDKTHQKTERHERAAQYKFSDLCPKHSPSEDKNITYECGDQGNSSESCKVKGFFTRFTVARMKCKPNYSPLEGAYFRSVCHESSWLPEIDDCFKHCDSLNPINVDLKCYRKGKDIPCNGGVLLAGTRVRPTCKRLHTYRDFIPTYREIVCQYDGKWDKMLFSCVPECGKIYQKAKKLIRGGKEETGDSPWHVAIYNIDEILICGGTIIHPFMVISAAHCFHTETEERQSANDFKVVVSKVSRTYNKTDNANQKIFKIREIRYPTKGYTGLNNYFAADIAILILKEKIAISPTVLPACVDWTGLNTNEYPPDGTLAKVVGWGMNEHQVYSEKLQTVDLPIINREHCLNTVPNDFKAYITYDKFCAGTEKGPSVLQGDSGGGLMLRDNGLYFLRGVVSLKQPTSTAIAAFTDLADHIDWIIATRNEIDQEILDKEAEEKDMAEKQKALEKICNKYDDQECKPFKDCPGSRDIVISRKAVFCGLDDKDKKMPKLCCPKPMIFYVTSAPKYPTPNSAVVNPNQVELGNTNTISTTSYPYIFERLPDCFQAPIIMDVINSTSSSNTNFPNCETSIFKQINYDNTSLSNKEAIIALPKEFPHMALIGFGNQFKDVEWLCSGSLINHNFVLSAARCVNTALGEPKWVMLGDLNITSIQDDAYAEVYSIIQIYLSNKSSIYENIALFELNTTVSIGNYVRPACLHAPTHVPIETTGVISGWGWSTKENNNTSNDHLLKAAITVVDNEQCKTLYDKNATSNFGERLDDGYQPETMLCAGNLDEGEALCANVDGSPLQIHKKNDICPWTIIAVSSFGHTSCGNVDEFANPYIFVKVNSHMDWIRSIVR